MRKAISALIILSVMAAGSFSLPLVNVETTLLFDMMSYGERTDGFVYQGIVGALDSSSAPSSSSLLVKAERSLGSGFIGGKIFLPVLKSTVRETWRFNGTEFQTNDLSYTFTALQVYGGYPFGPLGNMVFGLDMTKAEQTRNNFVQGGVPIPVGTSTELISSLNALAGFKGEQPFEPYTVEYDLGLMMPVAVSTTNTLLPGFNFSSVGYTMSAGVGVRMPVSPISSVSGAIRYMMIRYDGSGWVTQGGQTAKWPGNDTTSLGISVSYTTGF